MGYRYRSSATQIEALAPLDKAGREKYSQGGFPVSKKVVLLHMLNCPKLD